MRCPPAASPTIQPVRGARWKRTSFSNAKAAPGAPSAKRRSPATAAAATMRAKLLPPSSFALIVAAAAVAVDLLFADGAPGAAFAFEKLVRFHRAPRTGWIVGEAAGGQRMPDVQNGLNYIPAGFDHVGPLEERRVAGHAIAQQALVTGAVLGAEIGAVVEIHVDEAELHDRARNFGAEAERDAFVGLDVNDQAIRLQVFYSGVAKKNERSAAEMNDYFSGAPLEALSGAQVEGHAGPAPVVDLQLHGHERFRVGVPRDVGLAAIAVHGRAIDGAGTVLAANHAGEHVFGAERLDGVQHFGLFVAHFVGVKGDGRLHGGHGEQLEEMVGHHVAQGAGRFVKATAMLDADRFRGGGVHRGGLVSVPPRLRLFC